MGKVYRIVLEVDEGWLKVIDEVTNDVYDGEICEWKELKEIRKVDA